MFSGISKRPESKAKYDKTNRIADIVSRIIYYGAVYIVVPGFVLLIAIYSYFMYFTTDLGPDAFELAILIWYVMFLYSLNYIKVFFHPLSTKEII